MDNRKYLLKSSKEILQISLDFAAKLNPPWPVRLKMGFEIWVDEEGLRRYNITGLSDAYSEAERELKASADRQRARELAKA